MARSKSSRTWLRRHFTDGYVKRAQQEGFRSRAAYKLMEIDARDHLFRPGMVVVDLGAAPGGWAQYARQRVGASGRVFALDVLPIEPIPGVEIIQGDFTDPAVLDSLLGRLRTFTAHAIPAATGAKVEAERAVDLVMSDMAPNISGVAVVDQSRSIHLAELSMDFADKALRSGGTILIKAFQGEGFIGLQRELRRRVTKLVTRKPKASREESREVYLLGTGWAAAR